MMTSQEVNEISFTTNKNDLVQIFKALDNVVLDADFTLDNEGVMCRTMDSSHVSLIDIAIEKNDFEKYQTNLDNGKTIKFSLNVKEFLSILKELDKTGSIQIVIEKDHVKLNQNGFSFSIVKKAASESDCPLPKIAYQTEIQFLYMSNADLLKTFKKISSISDYVTFESSDNGLVLSGSGDNGKTNISLDHSKIMIGHREDSISTYNLEYIIPFLKSVTKDTKVKMEYATTKPLKISTNLGDSRIQFYLAPRVEN